MHLTPETVDQTPVDRPRRGSPSPRRSQKLRTIYSLKPSEPAYKASSISHPTSCLTMVGGVRTGSTNAVHDDDDHGRVPDAEAELEVVDRLRVYLQFETLPGGVASLKIVHKREK